MEILTSKSQLNLFGYNKLFNSFITLHKKNKLPNVMLLSGSKGLGKSTFAYHFINYLLSDKEENNYSYRLVFQNRDDLLIFRKSLKDNPDINNIRADMQS